MIDDEDHVRHLPVFDGHNDVLARILERPRFDFLSGAEAGHLSLPDARAAGFAGGFFAIFVAPTEGEKKRPYTFVGAGTTSDGGESASFQTPGAVRRGRAHNAVVRMFSRLRRLTEASGGRLVMARSTDYVRRAVDSHSPKGERLVAAVVHLEGAEAIDRRLEALDFCYEAGLRSLGLVWSRANRFATGVPFGFGRDADVGPGLTAAGRSLVTRCNELGIVIDLSHLNAKGFWEVAGLSTAPLVASHSNAWSLCRSTRNLTDKQLDAIRDSDGIVGINFGVPFLRVDGERREDTPLSAIGEHLEYIANRIGINRVGFGSDFDGVQIPKELGGVTGLPALIAHFRDRGWNDDELSKIAHENWIRVLGTTLRE